MDFVSNIIKNKFKNEPKEEQGSNNDERKQGSFFICSLSVHILFTINLH